MREKDIGNIVTLNDVALATIKEGVVLSLKDFIDNFICPNSFIRLWRDCGNGRCQMLFQKDVSKPGGIDDVCMEWQIKEEKVWQSKFAGCRVKGVKDIVCDGFYREAINIVLYI